MNLKFLPFVLGSLCSIASCSLIKDRRSEMNDTQRLLIVASVIAAALAVAFVMWGWADALAGQAICSDR